MTLKSLVRSLFGIARRLNDLDAYLTLDVRRIAKRQINKQIGRRIVGRFFLK